MAKILVTGSAGLIGSSIVDEMIRRGHDVYGVDNLSVCPIENVSEDAKGRFTLLDLRDKEKTKQYIEILKPDILYHCAAWAHEGLAQFSPALITENGINIFLNTIIPAINSGVKHVVFFSSVAVYGDQVPPFTEDMMKKPVDIYASCKAYIEDTLRVLSTVHGFTYTILRAYNVFGEKQSLTDPYRGVVAIFMNNILKGFPISIYGDGEQKRIFTYVGDITKTICDCATEKKAVNEIFNIGDERVRTVNELLGAIEKASGSVVKRVHLPDRAQEVKVAYCDNSKAKIVLGLDITTSFEQAIKNTWEYASKMGAQNLKYLPSFEIPSTKIPKNWIQQ